MWRRGTVLSVGSLLIAAAALVFTLQTAHAAGGNGLRVSPVRSDITVSPGTTQTVNITVTNVTADASDLQTIVNDFTASPDESGNPAIILNPAQYASSHSLKRFIGPVSHFTLAPGQSKAIPIVITVPKNATGGGYFGAIRFAPASATTSSRCSAAPSRRLRSQAHQAMAQASMPRCTRRYVSASVPPIGTVAAASSAALRAFSACSVP